MRYLQLLMNSTALPVFAPKDDKGAKPPGTENETDPPIEGEEIETEENEAPEWQARLDEIAAQVATLAGKLEAREAAEAEAKANGTPSELETAKAATLAAETKLAALEAELAELKKTAPKTPSKPQAKKRPAQSAGAPEKVIPVTKDQKRQREPRRVLQRL